MRVQPSHGFLIGTEPRHPGGVHVTSDDFKRFIQFRSFENDLDNAAIADLPVGLINSRSFDNGKTILHLLAEAGKTDMLYRLIEKGGDMSIEDGDGHTATYYAAAYTHNKGASRPGEPAGDELISKFEDPGQIIEYKGVVIGIEGATEEEVASIKQTIDRIETSGDGHKILDYARAEGTIIRIDRELDGELGNNTSGDIRLSDAWLSHSDENKTHLLTHELVHTFQPRTEKVEGVHEIFADVLAARVTYEVHGSYDLRNSVGYLGDYTIDGSGSDYEQKIYNHGMREWLNDHRSLNIENDIMSGDLDMSAYNEQLELIGVDLNIDFTDEGALPDRDDR